MSTLPGWWARGFRGPERQIAALRKRVSELERERADHERAQDEAEKKAVAFAEKMVAFQARAEQAERARDEWREMENERTLELQAVCQELRAIEQRAEALQADLDAALVFCGKMLGWSPGLFSQSDEGKRVLALLEKRQAGGEASDARRGGWLCSNCGHAEQRESEILCWKCGKGEMRFCASLGFPVEPRRG